MEELEKVRSLHIELVGIEDEQVLSKVKELLLSSTGQDPVFIRMDGKAIAAGKSFHVEINPELVNQLEELLGSGSVNVIYKAVKKEKESEAVSF